MAGVRDKLLTFALAFPGASLDHPWGEDVAKVNGKIFVFLGPSVSKRMTVKLDESHGHALAIDGAAPSPSRTCQAVTGRCRCGRRA